MLKTLITFLIIYFPSIGYCQYSLDSTDTGSNINNTRLLQLNLKTAELDHQQALWNYSRSSLLYRMIPKITFSAGLNSSRTLFNYYETDNLEGLPRNGYRLTLTWNVTELLSSETRNKSYFNLKTVSLRYEHCRLELELANADRDSQRAALQRKISHLERMVAFTEEEIAYHQELLKLAEIRFSQTDKFSDEIIRNKLSLLSLRRKLSDERFQLEELKYLAHGLNHRN